MGKRRSDAESDLDAGCSPVVRAHCRGVPIYSYGYTQVLGESPDLVEDARLQEGNDVPAVKVHPKKSWEISSSRLGADVARMPRSARNDYLPLEPIHLIDGNLETCWSSHAFSGPDVEPVWIRIDLPMERDISRVVLKKRPRERASRNAVGSMGLDPGAVEVGMAMPAELTVKVSRDGQRWETLFSGETRDTPETMEFALAVGSIAAKQIWIIGRRLPRVENWLHAFSISQVEVVDLRGRNVALATLGAGVTVSSTLHGFGAERDAYRWYWPLHWDLGLKWIRLGFHDDAINWHWVEQERGKLEVDAVADQAISEMVEHGVNVVMALGFGNRLYTNEDPRRNLPQLWEWYYENPKPPTTPGALEAWGRYVRYMADRFGERVKVFEIWNEWNVAPYWGAELNLEHYVAIARTAIPILREVCPDVPILLGSVAGFPFGISRWTAKERKAQERESLILRSVRELAREVDAIGWHPFYQTDPESESFRGYAKDVPVFKAYCESHGFRGEYMVTEWGYGANYPAPTPPNWWGSFEASEMQKAKYIAQITVKHVALGVNSFFCASCDNNYPLDLSLLRRAFVSEPITPLQPQAGYYVMRNLATALEGLSPSNAKFRLESALDDIEAFAMGREGEIVLALWLPGRAKDVCKGERCDVTVEGVYTAATGYNPMNGTAQPVFLQRMGRRTRLPGIVLRDFPVLIRLK